MSNKFFHKLGMFNKNDNLHCRNTLFQKKNNYGSLMACIFVLMCFPFD